MTQRILIIGATSAIAHEAAKVWAGQGASLYLLARDKAKLKAVADDLAVRGAEVKTGAYDTAMEPAALAKLVAKVWKEWDGLDGVLLAHGWLPVQEEVQDDAAVVSDVTVVNGVSVIQLLALLAPKLEAQGHGWLAAISSVAGDRGRAKMYVYGGAKALVQHWLEGLRQRLAPVGVRVIDIRPGPVDTPMTTGLAMPLMADVASVGAGVARACATANGTVYLPWFWRYIFMVLSHIPGFVWVKVRI
ncbi:MAG: SDR family NAD(P)-dependent oxidoreductase [Alphaproteobacteria bacterium]